MFSQSLQPSVAGPLPPEQTCPNLTLLHSRHKTRHLTLRASVQEERVPSLLWASGRQGRVGPVSAHGTQRRTATLGRLGE